MFKMNKVMIKVIKDYNQEECSELSEYWTRDCSWKNIQNNWEIEQETINKISYKKQDVTFIKDIETTKSINLAINTEIDIVEKESENNLTLTIRPW